MSQVILPFPTNKPQLYEHPEYYDAWKKSSENDNKLIIDGKRDQFSYWNQFVDYSKALTDDPNDILYLFFNGFENDKDGFCRRYTSSHSFLNEKYYHREKIIMDKMCECVFLSYNKNLIKKLKIIKEKDQRFRQKNTYDLDKQRPLDLENQKAILSIYNYYGYTNRKLVGVQYEGVMFQVIQHSNLKMMESFLPIILHEVKVNGLYGRNYALLHDRISVLKGEPQIFATQSKEDELGNTKLAKTIKDFDLINKKRKEFGLKEIPDLRK